MHCRLCHRSLQYVHGHATCLRSGCPMYGVNQAECCDGETVANCPAPTATVAAVYPGAAPQPSGSEVDAG